MASFEELLALAREPGENGLPDTIYDDMEFAYQDALAQAAQDADGNTARIQELESRVSKLTSENYDLLMNSSATGNEGDTSGNGAPGSESDEDDEPDTKTIDDLFG